MMKINGLPVKCHNLKLREDFCDDVCMGLKNFEVRENDRGFQKGMSIPEVKEEKTTQQKTNKSKENKDKNIVKNNVEGKLRQALK